ncbi:cytidine deaminase [Polyangium sp. y55x31]|uniref:cytidine deaminase n=1 Tax=Polyangium sp. y55x31 TaxID=3042688 RepID=UPI0024827CFA|nr:cytidine deaminase [Polyangium sp. y55x31]MDI1484454.1 cytidine deaminase [Polyangium sp. y55x31]
MIDPQTTIDWAALERAALDVQTRAHAPYSTYQVGAALLTASGRIFTGCNVENASYGLSICAERSAIVQMVAAGERDPIALTVVTPGSSKLGPDVSSPPIGAPCGMCRQTLAEFADDMPIRMLVAGHDGLSRRTSLAALLPEAFRARSS